MATSEVDQKTLGNLAQRVAGVDPLLSRSLYQLLGLSVLLSRKLYRARRLRKLDPTRDTKSLALYHHILWLAREGLSILETSVLPHAQVAVCGADGVVLTGKLRASFLHVFCLFHNTPPVSQLRSPQDEAGKGGKAVTESGPGLGLSDASPTETMKGSDRSPPRYTTGSPVLKSNAVAHATSKMGAVGSAPPRNSAASSKTDYLDPDRLPLQKTRLSGTTPLRDPIPSMTSETSYVTNPFAGTSPPTQSQGLSQGPPSGLPYPLPQPLPHALHSRSQSDPHATLGLPPSFVAAAQLQPPPGLGLRAPAHPADFILPSTNFVPRAARHFGAATAAASRLLPGSHPLRLSVALEHAAFMWDCAHEHEAARRLARRAIRDVYRAHEGMDDADFADAAELVAVLGRLMRRASWEGTPRAVAAAAAASVAGSSSTSLLRGENSGHGEDMQDGRALTQQDSSRDPYPSTPSRQTVQTEPQPGRQPHTESG